MNPREKRALLRRQRLESQANQRLETIFTGSGVSAPPGIETTSVPSEKMISEEITPTKVEEKIENEVKPDLVEEKQPISIPVVEKDVKSDIVSSGKLENENIKRKKDALESIKKAKRSAESSVNNKKSIGNQIRILTAMLMSFLFIYNNFSDAILIAMIIIDISLSYIASWLSKQKQTQPVLDIPILSMITKGQSLLSSIQSFISTFSIFALCTILLIDLQSFFSFK